MTPMFATPRNEARATGVFCNYREHEMTIESPDRGRRAAAATNPTPPPVPGCEARVPAAPALGPPPAPAPVRRLPAEPGEA